MQTHTHNHTCMHMPRGEHLGPLILLRLEARFLFLVLVLVRVVVLVQVLFPLPPRGRRLLLHQLLERVCVRACASAITHMDMSECRCAPPAS